MAGSPIKLAIDRQNQVLLTGQPLFASDTPELYQYDIKDLVAQVYDPGGTAAAPTPVDYTGYTGYVSLGLPGGGANSTIYSGPTALVWNAAPGNPAVTGNSAGYFTGALDMTQAAIQAAFTAAGNPASLTAQLEFNVKLAGVMQVLVQLTVTIVAVVNQGASSGTPNPPSAYATTLENNQQYLRKAGTTADQKIWISQNGTYAVLQYLGNDGVMHWDPINPPPVAVP